MFQVAQDGGGAAGDDEGVRVQQRCPCSKYGLCSTLWPESPRGPTLHQEQEEEEEEEEERVCRLLGRHWLITDSDGTVNEVPPAPYPSFALPASLPPVPLPP